MHQRCEPALFMHQRCEPALVWKHLMARSCYILIPLGHLNQKKKMPE